MKKKKITRKVSFIKKLGLYMCKYLKKKKREKKNSQAGFCEVITVSKLTS